VITSVIAAGGCEHATGIDQDHAALGAITVQLFPYDDTPNNGDEYKVWVTLIEDFDLDAPNNTHGFVNADSKTDNFKAPPGPVCPPCECPPKDDHTAFTTDGESEECPCVCPEPEPEPCCGDGTVDPGEECDDGNTTSNDGCSSTCETEEEYLPPTAPRPDVLCPTCGSTTQSMPEGIFLL
jgi:cysteine-rich repeat protein